MAPSLRLPDGCVRRPASGWTVRRALLLLLSTLHGALSGVAGARPVINELMPDPAGSDAGAEYVELLNPGPAPLPLVGLELQFANGAEEARWTSRWTGSDGDTLAPGGRFLIVDRNWTGTAFDAEVWLGLQNGPDAVRLARNGATLDLVGYGALTDTLLFEGAPVALTPGRSLARRPDGADSDVNAVDFVAADPTPGRPNFLPFDVAAVSVEAEPPSLVATGDEMKLTVDLRNRGTETLASVRVELVGDVAARPILLDMMPPDASRVLVWQASVLRVGRVSLAAHVPVDQDRDTLRVALGSIQVGPADLVLNEVLAAPARAQGEWIELMSVSDTTLQLDAYEVRDEDGSWRTLPAAPLWPGERVVVAQDSAGLAVWLQDTAAHGAPSTCRPERRPVIRGLSGWPSLNNSPPQDRVFADRVRLRRDGVVIDHVTLGGAGFPENDAASWERIAPRRLQPGAALWATSTHPAGSTPGCPNSVASGSWGPSQDTGTAMRLSTPVLDRQQGPTTVHVRFELQAPAVAWDLGIYDLWGRRIRDLGGDGDGAGARETLWSSQDDSGAPVDPGAYLMLLRLRDAAGSVLGRHKALLVVR